MQMSRAHMSWAILSGIHFADATVCVKAGRLWYMNSALVIRHTLYEVYVVRDA